MSAAWTSPGASWPSGRARVPDPDRGCCGRGATGIVAGAQRESDQFLLGHSTQVVDVPAHDAVRVTQQQQVA